MDNIYLVTIHIDNDYGCVEYDQEQKKITVVLPNEAKRQEVMNYLAQEHTIRVPHECLVDFTTEVIKPNNSLADFKLALTRLWDQTGVLVDWSYPHTYAQMSAICG